MNNEDIQKMVEVGERVTREYSLKWMKAHEEEIAEKMRKIELLQNKSVFEEEYDEIISFYYKKIFR